MHLAAVGLLPARDLPALFAVCALIGVALLVSLPLVGAVLISGAHERELSGGAASTTNNRMELTAVIEALRLLKEPCVVELYSDSRYVIDALEKRWVYGWKQRGWVKSDKKPALNVDLWEQLLSLIARHEMHYHWVKGHAENEYNNRCDEMAVAEWHKFK